MGLPEFCRFSLASAFLALIPAALMAAPATISAALSGSATSKGGDPDGSGGFSVTLDPDTHDFCYTLWAAKIGKPTQAHLHTGTAGTDGAAVVTLDVTGKADEQCIALAKAKAQALIDNPGDFYVDVHTADFPDGAIRGQLVR
jgi:hypothetical protein